MACFTKTLGSISMSNLLLALCGALHLTFSSEGNWHNCIMAMVYCRLADVMHEQRWLQLARRSMSSLYALNADTTGLLRTRSHSPYWDHAPLPNPRHEAYYQADNARKFRSQAIAVIACSFLLGRPRFRAQGVTQWQVSPLSTTSTNS
jgi:hypothetical protein